MDFYEELSLRENEAMRRAGRIRDAERQAAQSFHRPPPAPGQRKEKPPRSAKKQESGVLGGLLGGNLLRRELFASSDFSLLFVLFLILKTEQNDPLLMLALIYILM